MPVLDAEIPSDRDRVHDFSHQSLDDEFPSRQLETIPTGSLLPIELLTRMFEGGQIFELLPQTIRDAKRAAPVTREYILAALNTGAKFGEKRWASDKAVFMNLDVNVELLKASYAEATNELQRSLRLLVDEWLDTGRQDDGSEYPYRRDLLQTRIALIAWIKYVRRYPPLPRYVAGTVQWLFTTIPEIGAPLADRDLPIPAAVEEAYRLFAGLILAADWRASICKCRHPRCGKYFVIRTPQAAYKNGTCEPQCRKRLSAEQTVGAARADRTNRRIRSARKAFEKYSRTHEGLALKQKIKEAVNGDRPRAVEDHITVKWVTRNWTTITSIGKGVNDGQAKEQGAR